MPYVDIGDVSLYYEACGEGEPLVFINGWQMSLGLFSPIIPLYKSTYHVVTFDNRGAGKSDAPEGPYSLEIMAEDLKVLLDFLCIEKAHLIGHSMGARIAEEMALRYPERVRTIVLAGPATWNAGIGWMPQPVTGEYLRYRNAQPVEERARRLLADRVHDGFIEDNPDCAEMLITTIRDGFGPSHAQTGHTIASNSYDNFDRLPDIDVPVLILAGREDKTVPLENIMILKNRIPGADLAVIEGVRHFMMWEAYEEVNHIILDFLGRHRDKNTVVEINKNE